MSLSSADARLNVPIPGTDTAGEDASEAHLSSVASGMPTAVPGSLHRKCMSEKLKKRGEKSRKRLQRRLAKAEARADFRAAEHFRLCISRSYYIRVGMLVEEMDRQNGRRRPAFRPTVDAGSSRCNSLQRDRNMLTDITWHDEEIAPNEVVIENEIVKLASDCISTRRWRPYRNADATRKAQNLHLGKAPRDLYAVFPMTKSGGGLRPIHAFGPADRVRQRLALAAYGDRLKTAPGIYSAKGNGGRGAALAKVISLLELDGAVAWAVPLDIKGFFNSVNREWLVENLPLPKAFTRSTILLDDGGEDVGEFMRDCFGMARTRAKLTGVGQVDDMMLRELWNTSRAGLPQGAATSSAVATHIVADVLDLIELPQGIFLIVYADDMLILGARKDAVERAVETLCGTFASHPAGPFVLHRANPRRISDGFQFLGMSFRRERGRVECRPNVDVLRRVRTRIVKTTLSVLEGTAEFAVLENVLTRAAASFDPWSMRWNWVWSVARQFKVAFPELSPRSNQLLARLRRAAFVEIEEYGRRVGRATSSGACKSVIDTADRFRFGGAHEAT
ncbi:reverse transcriptase domain-containing protein [Sinorhizobium medicae]|uniref:Reverse transcriptase domain-containing protein n=1 Tax=Sinorhizobium medicae TaxID=110321 RepID=A0ABX4TF30_9HYPH|nr:reverse transcriptase domain-containing protein [Sinorhizobium medicae]PLT97182.1 hypothetical protein BMJ33_26355 [Sinorhizobium medicae]PLU23636.1 hypothetical protein BMJ29_04505 [Sinorhizobium medicae]PLU79520.1 hypothetical protein BMJ19_12490 [Sinorhizobium medicae]